MIALLHDFSRYLGQVAEVDLAVDGVSYRKGGIYLSDEELATLQEGMMRLLQPHLANPPQPGRRRRIIVSIMLPDVEG